MVRLPPLGYKIKIAGSHFDNFICLYYIGAYIKRYGLPFLEKKCNALLLIFVIECIVCLYQITFVAFHFLNKSWYMHLTGLSSIFTTLPAVAMFMLFKNLKIDDNPVIYYFASSTFAVFLITGNIFINKILWADIFHCNDYSNLFYLISNLLLTLVVSYSVSVFIDKIRIKFFSKNILSFLEKQYNKAYEYITKFI